MPQNGSISAAAFGKGAAAGKRNNRRLQQGGAEADFTTKGAISLLQEFVQGSTKINMPSNQPVLQWKFASRMADEATLQFRATVAFLLDGIPHHAAGSWHPSKKQAQRDTADRALSFFVGRWGQQLLAEQIEDTSLPMRLRVEDEAQELHSFCRSCDLCGGALPEYTISELEGGAWQAHAEVRLVGVSHKFKGAPRRTQEEAKADVARRVLWYLQRPGFDDLYELDPDDPAVVSLKIPTAPENWTNDLVVAGEGVETAEKKTAVMRVQNRLQQLLSKKLKPGESVWDWKYEADPQDENWPPLYRASVCIPVISRQFIGEWARGQRQAQLSTLQHVTTFLDEYVGDKGC